MIQQLSPEWREARRGKVTASRVADLLAKTKNGFAASRENYAAELLCERLTGIPAEHYTSKPMEWGRQYEPEARAFYEFVEGVELAPAEFVQHPVIKDFGGSPDGLIGDDGLIQIKCPNTTTHLSYLTRRMVPPEYFIQIQSELCVTGRAWSDFVSYDPRLPVRYRLITIRIPRDAPAIAAIELEVSIFLEALAARITELEEVAHAQA